MKSIKYIAAVAATAALMLASSCTDKVKYDPTPDYASAGVYFSKDAATDIALANDATSTTVYVNRVKTDGELTVPLKSTVTDVDGLEVSGIFTVPASVTFAAGQAVAPVVIGVNFAEVIPGDDYTISIAIEAETSPYGATEQTYTLSYSPWLDPVRVPEDDQSLRLPCTTTYTFPFNSPLEFQQYLYSQKSIVNENIKRYTVPTPYYNAIPYDLVFDVNYAETVMVDGQECYSVTTPMIPCYELDPDGLATFLDAFTWSSLFLLNRYGVDDPEEVKEWMEEQGWGGSYFNPVTGMCVLDMVAYPAANDWGYMYNQLNDFTWTVLFPGYESYAFEYAVKGNFVDNTGAESVMIQVFKTDNIASFAAIAKPGKLTEEEIAAAAEELKADDSKQFYTESGTTIAVPVDEEGDYTLVTVGYDEGYTAIFTDSFNFTFKTVQSNSEWESFGEADYTDAFLSSIFTAVDAVTYPVKVEKHKQTEGLYRLVNPYAEWSKYSGFEADMAEGNYYLYIDATDPQNVDIPYSELGISLVPSYGYVNVMSQANLIIEAGNATKEELQSYGYYGTMVDGEVTFPAGAIVGAMTGYNSGKWSFYLNVDPENPTLADDYEGDFDPYYGYGEFHVSIYNLMPDGQAAAPKRHAPMGKVGSKLAKSFNLGSSNGRKVRKMSQAELGGADTKTIKMKTR